MPYAPIPIPPEFDHDSDAGRKITKVRLRALRNAYKDRGYNGFTLARTEREALIMLYWANLDHWPLVTQELAYVTYKWANTKRAFDKFYAEKMGEAS